MYSLPRNHRRTAFAASCIGVFAFALCWLPSARALEVLSGTANNTAPGTVFNGQTFDQPLPWDNVGQLNGSGAVYLGDIDNDGKYWVLTAQHVAPTLPASVSFDGTPYGTVAGSYVQLTSPDNSAADMVLFQLDVSGNPSGLVTLTLSNTTPSIGTDVYYVGYGSAPKLWGWNTVAGYGHGDDMHGTIYAFDTVYDTSAMDKNEAQAVGGDSGGGAFIYNATTHSWELGGMMVAVDSLSDPTITYNMDIATYNADIFASIPEPGPGKLLLGGAGVMLLAGAARKRSRGKEIR